ncbi:MAG: hypothetical protein ACI8UO_004027 [Verrucomicrobiales bacterium]|jgi:uncharacterized protein YqjF (DUF2071 family)
MPKGPWIMRQRWCDLLFAHWPVPSKSLRELVPPELEIQEFDGVSWVGVVPFRMEGVAPRGIPSLPWVSAFPELNLRLYVEHDGKPGVWFLSLDAANRVAVWAARKFFHLPYFNAKMQCQTVGNRVHYLSQRNQGNWAFRGDYEPTGSAYESKPGTLENWLTERYCLYAKSTGGRLFSAEIQHAPWPLQRAEAEIHENQIGEAFGIEIPDSEPVLHFSKRLDVVVWPLRLTGR